MSGSKKPVGLVLMDQSMVAGIGNIYRAEILFKVCLIPSESPLRSQHTPISVWDLMVNDEVDQAVVSRALVEKVPK